MLANLKHENFKLREKLKLLRQETEKSLDESVIGALATSPASDKLKYMLNSQVDTDQGGVMLSDKAKVVRGEASKRIGVLLQDWRDFKERSENELRRKLRTEQNLKELIARKDRELEELSYEISSYRTLAMEQKNTIEILLEEKEIGEKCKVKCAELERLLAKERRYNGEVSTELRSRDDILRQSSAEKEALLALNNELRAANAAQKKRLEMCERDVTETSHELEMLEEMVKALQDRKTMFDPHSAQQAAKIMGLSDMTASMRIPQARGASTQKTISFHPQLNSTMKDPSPVTPFRSSLQRDAARNPMTSTSLQSEHLTRNYVMPTSLQSENITRNNVIPNSLQSDNITRNNMMPTSLQSDNVTRKQVITTSLQSENVVRNQLIPTSVEGDNSESLQKAKPSPSSTGSSGHTRSSEGSKETVNSFMSKKSAMSALESLQKDHNKKCNYLAEHIKKLKEENKEKEDRLRQLESHPPT